MLLCEGGTIHKEQHDSWSEIIDSMVLPGWEHWGWLNGIERKIQEFQSLDVHTAGRECSASTISIHVWYWILFKAKVPHHLKTVLQKENYKWANNTLDLKRIHYDLGITKLMKCLLLMHEGLYLIPRIHTKMEGVVMYTRSSSTGETATGRSQGSLHIHSMCIHTNTHSHKHTTQTEDNLSWQSWLHCSYLRNRWIVENKTS